MSKVKITQTRSLISRPIDQKSTMKALGLGKIGRSVEVSVNPAISGMLRKVNHLISIENI
ncbi:MAG: 50S ribosomal protein L30 [Leadbetterella sp.]